MRLLDPDGKIKNTCQNPVWQHFTDNNNSAEARQTAEKLKSLKLITQDPVSGPGHYIFLPRGAIMFNLLKDYLYGLYAQFGCFYLESPILTDFEHSAVQNHAEQSGETTYHTTSSGQHLITKIGALYSQLEYVSQNGLPPHSMPLKLFEMTKCCRIEKNINPLSRSCEFTMTDMHQLCADLDQACSDSLAIHQRIIDLAKEFDMKFYCTFTVTDEFLRDRKAYLTELTRMHEKEAMLLRADPEKGRPINVEYHIDPGFGKPLEVSAFQIDCQNPKAFNILNRNGSHPVLIHANIVGSIERFMYALSIDVIQKKRYPLWLAPEQIRLIPSSNKDTGTCMSCASKLKTQKLRVLVDDRDHISPRKKISIAKEAILPCIVLVENKSMTCLATDSDQKGTTVSMDGLIQNIESRIKGKPRMEAAFPLALAQWPDYF